MRFLPDVSIKRKQMIIIMLTSSAAVLLACVAFVIYEWHTFRDEMRRNLIGMADRIGERTVALPNFEDKTAATGVLKTVLVKEPDIVVACLYRKDGKLIASYRRAEEIGYFNVPAFPQRSGFDLTQEALTLVRPLAVNGVEFGVIYLESDLRAMRERVLRYAGIMFSVWLVSSVLAFILSSRLQRFISEPIIHLAGVAKIVSQKKNYAVRAEKYGEGGEQKDELNLLIDGFNEMLAQIQQRDGELQKARDELEKRVEERTRDLLQEIAERSRAEKALQQQFARISLLNQITHSISERMDLRSVLNIVLKQLEDHLPADFGAVFVTNNAGDFVLAANSSPQPLPSEAAYRFARDSVMSSKQAGLQDCTKNLAVVIPDTSLNNAPMMFLLARSGLKSLVAVPMIVEDKLFGVLMVARKNVDSFSEGECEFLRMLSEQVALAAHQARLHTELQGAYNDLRQTQHAVMQQQRLQALGQMASGIAHDINNALSPIIVYSELVLRNEKALAEGSRRHLHNIKTAGEDIAHIVSRMREFYRRREENEQLVSVNFNQLAGQVIELTRPRWRDIPQQKGIVVDMQADLDPAIPELYASGSELREALTNLILNSVDAMPAGGTLTIRTRLAPEDSKSTAHIILEVCDTGVGMDEETRKRCLEPFFSTKGQRGTGLGLAMVYGIMERHDGSIEIDSAPGKGSVMRLIFPVRDGARLDEETTNFMKGIPITPLNVLCIDDEPLLRQLLKEILEGDGHSVVIADGGQSGIDAFRATKAKGENFDVVITDLGMPYVDGRQVACVLKKESAKTPIILLTGWGSMMKADGETPPQVDAVLSKPPRISELREALMKLGKGESVESLS